MKAQNKYRSINNNKTCTPFSCQTTAYGQVNAVSLVAASHRLVVAVRSSLYLLDWGVAGDAALRLLTTVDLGMPDNVINEAKPDSLGRYWAGEVDTITSQREST